MSNEKRKHTLRDFLNYNVGIAEDQQQAVIDHECLRVDDELIGDDHLNMIILELFLDDKLAEDDARNLYKDTPNFKAWTM